MVSQCLLSTKEDPMSLPSPISVNPQARDIVFRFQDSCNCCTSCKPARSPRLYVGSDGRIEPFSSRKARRNTEEAFNRAISHLNATLERRVSTFHGDIVIFQRKAESILASIYALQTINLSHIEALNDLMIRYAQEVALGERHVLFDDEVMPPSLVVEEPIATKSSSCLIL